MIVLSSTLENIEEPYKDLQRFFGKHQFTLGGNWDYTHGFFDRNLDGENKAWLRIPFQVTAGDFDGEAEESDAVIRLGSPFVLYHLYQEGNDHGIAPRLAASLIDQFQKPADPDAPVSEEWVEAAEKVLRQVEHDYASTRR